MSLVLLLAAKQLFKHILRACYRLKYVSINTSPTDFPVQREKKNRVKCSSDGQKVLTL